MNTKNVKKAIFWSIMPGLVFIVVDLLFGIRGEISFYMFLILFPCIVVIGIYIVVIEIYLLRLLWDIYKKSRAKINSKNSVLILISIMGFYLLLPFTMSIINSIKIDFYFYKNQDELEQIANNILNSKWTIEEANTYMEQRSFDIKVFDYEPQSKTVLYIIGGMNYNYGIAYSKTGKKYHSDRLRRWDNIRTNWYDWSIE